MGMTPLREPCRRAHVARGRSLGPAAAAGGDDGPEEAPTGGEGMPAELRLLA